MVSMMLGQQADVCVRAGHVHRVSCTPANQLHTAGDTIVRPSSTNLEALPFSTACSASKSVAVAETCGKVGRSVVQEPCSADAVGRIGDGKRRALVPRVPKSNSPDT